MTGAVGQMTHGTAQDGANAGWWRRTRRAHARCMNRAPAPFAPLALAAAVAQVVFVGSWLTVGSAEGHGYDWRRHDISDLGALTAQHPTAFRMLLLLTGATTIAFGLLVVRPLLGTATGVLVALSLPAFDNATDFFFRLDCRAADAGCGTSEAVASWHGKAHLACFAVAAIATIAAPFVAARAMRRREAWRPFVPTARWAGVVTVVLLLAAGATSGTAVQGLAQRVAATVIPLGLAAFAVLLHQRQPAAVPVAGLQGGR